MPRESHTNSKARSKYTMDFRFVVVFIFIPFQLSQTTMYVCVCVGVAEYIICKLISINYIVGRDMIALCALIIIGNALLHYV